MDKYCEQRGHCPWWETSDPALTRLACRFRRLLLTASVQSGEHHDEQGMCYRKKDLKYDTEPTTGSEGYSYRGTKQFTKELSEKLGMYVIIRKRVIVFSAGWKSFEESRSWMQFNFQVAKEKNVSIWTQQMLQPTISALVIEPALEVSNEWDD